MSLLLTAPTRIAIMAYDASTLIKMTSEWFKPTVDADMRMAVLVETAEDQEPPVGAGIEMPLETYNLYLIGPVYNTPDDNHAAERKTRQAASEILTYFRARTQLQFHNVRNHPDRAALGPLAGVKWSRIRQTSGIEPQSKGELDPYWGCSFALNLETMVSAMERL